MLKNVAQLILNRSAGIGGMHVLFEGKIPQQQKVRITTSSLLVAGHTINVDKELRTMRRRDVIMISYTSTTTSTSSSPDNTTSSSFVGEISDPEART